jgi:hypothetical protein
MEKAGSQRFQRGAVTDSVRAILRGKVTSR